MEYSSNFDQKISEYIPYKYDNYYRLIHPNYNYDYLTVSKVCCFFLHEEKDLDKKNLKQIDLCKQIYDNNEIISECNIHTNFYEDVLIFETFDQAKKYIDKIQSYKVLNKLAGIRE